MMKLWNVYLDGKLFDSVYFDTSKNNSPDTVRRELIVIDNYPKEITVKPAIIEPAMEWRIDV